MEQVGGPLSPRRLAHRAHPLLTAALDAGVRGPRGGCCRRWCLAIGSRPGEEVEAGFRAAGALHVLSVSGLHLTAIAGFLFLIVRRPLIGVPLAGPAGAGRTGRRRWLCLPALGLYTLLTGEAVATARAA